MRAPTNAPGRSIQRSPVQWQANGKRTPPPPRRALTKKSVSFVDVHGLRNGVGDQENTRVNALQRCQSESKICCSPSIRRVPRLKAIDKYHLLKERPDLDFGEKLPELTRRFSDREFFSFAAPVLVEAETFYDTRSYNEEDNEDEDADGDVFFEVQIFSEHDGLSSKENNVAQSQYSDYKHFWSEIRAKNGSNKSPSVQALTAA